jgi:hypothetical protein
MLLRIGADLAALGLLRSPVHRKAMEAGDKHRHDDASEET